MYKAIMTRKVDHLGRIVLPAEIRATLNWVEKTPLLIMYNDEKREVTLKQRQPCCTYCAKESELLQFHEGYICKACREEIAQL